MNSTSLTLDCLKKGTLATINSFDDAVVEEKMLEMGCLPGSKVELDRIAPLGDPILIKISGGNLALRKDEAQHISISITH